MAAFTRKHALLLLLGPLGLAAAYLALVALIGWRVAAEVKRYEALLVARDDVSVVEFDYARDLWGGELTYRLVWRPARSADAVAELLSALALDEQRFTLAGTVAVRHGPWLGGIDAGLARLAIDVSPPALLRDALPDYPGKSPLLTVQGTLGFTRSLRAEVALVNYDGALLDGSDDATLQSYGVTGELRANPSLSAFDITLTLPLFSLDDGSLSVALEQLRSVNRLQREEDAWQLVADFSLDTLEVTDTRPAADGGGTRVALRGLQLQVDAGKQAAEPVLGRSELALAELGIDAPANDVTLAFSDYAANGRTTLVDGMVENTGTMRLGAFRLDGRALGGFTLGTSLRGVSAATYAALDEHWPTLGSEGDLGVWGEALRALAQETLVLTIDPLALQLPSEDDVSASLRVQYNGSEDVAVDSLPTIVKALEVEGSLQASVAALERTLLRAALESEQQAAAEAQLESLYAQPWVTLDKGQLSSALTLRNGELTVNGQPVDVLATWLASLEAGTTPAPVADAVAKSRGAAAGCPDLSLTGTPLAYGSDELYLTRSHKVTAGGSLDLSLCAAEAIKGFGYVEAAPDFELAYAHDPSNGDLEFRVDSKCDSVLLINDPQGLWYFDDDSNGNQDALIRLGNPVSGNYDIWVGSYEANGCSAQLVMESF